MSEIRTARESLHALLLRLLTLSVGVVLVAVSVPFVGQPLGGIIPLSFDWPGMNAGLDATNLPFRPAALYVVSGLVLGTVGALLLALALIPARRRNKMIYLKPATNRGFGGGTVRISERSVRDLVSGAAERVSGVREAVTRIRLRNDGWRVHCRISVASETSMTQASEAVQRSVSQALETHTGLPAARVDIETQAAMLEAARSLH